MDNSAQLDEIKQLLVQKVGLRFPQDSNGHFIGLLQERSRRLGHATLDDYRIFLEGDNALPEWQEIVRTLTSSETYFFRDQGQFDLLRLSLLPELIARHSHQKTLRIWCAGCSSGEEAYSLAMLVDMLLPERSDWEILILGTDIDAAALAKARHGHYRQWSFRMVPAELQQRYFHKVGHQWELDDRIRRMVTFRIANLVTAPIPDPLSGPCDMDLILCRNVFIYFEPATVSAVATKLSYALVEGGYLMTAHTELMGYQIELLETRLFPEGVVYQRHPFLPARVVTPLPVPSIVVDRSTSFQVNSFPVQENSAKETRKSGQDLTSPVADLCTSARSHADQGEYELAELKCREALTAEPLAVVPYYLLAQLAQLKGDFNQAKECLNKAIYLDHRYVAAYLELAALYERERNIPQTKALRHAALAIMREMPKDEQIEHYERTAGELSQWLAQLESSADSVVSSDGNHSRSHHHDQ